MKGNFGHIWLLKGCHSPFNFYLSSQSSQVPFKGQHPSLPCHFSTGYEPKTAFWFFLPTNRIQVTPIDFSISQFIPILSFHSYKVPERIPERLVRLIMAFKTTLARYPSNWTSLGITHVLWLGIRPRMKESNQQCSDTEAGVVLIEPLMTT